MGRPGLVGDRGATGLSGGRVGDGSKPRGSPGPAMGPAADRTAEGGGIRRHPLPVGEEDAALVEYPPFGPKKGVLAPGFVPIGAKRGVTRKTRCGQEGPVVTREPSAPTPVTTPEEGFGPGSFLL